MEGKPIVLFTGGFGTIGLSMQDVVSELKLKLRPQIDKQQALEVLKDK